MDKNCWGLHSRQQGHYISVGTVQCKLHEFTFTAMVLVIVMMPLPSTRLLLSHRHSSCGRGPACTGRPTSGRWRPAPRPRPSPSCWWRPADPAPVPGRSSAWCRASHLASSLQEIWSRWGQVCLQSKEEWSLPWLCCEPPPPSASPCSWDLRSLHRTELLQTWIVLIISSWKEYLIPPSPHILHSEIWSSDDRLTRSAVIS